MKTLKHFFLSSFIALLLASNAAQAQYATYAEWMAAKFTPPERNNAAISGPKADADRDGVANLLEYAFGLAPKQTDAPLMPHGTRVGDHLSITYSRPSSITDLDYTVQVSDDLVHWYSGAGYTLQPDPAIDNGTTITTTVNDAVVGAVKRFMRVSVSSKTVLTIVTQPTATPNPVTGLTTNLAVTAADLQGDAQLIYAWSMASGPSPVAFAPNGTNGSKQSVATFSAPGTYSLQVTVTNLGNNVVATGSVAVTVNQGKSIAVSPQAAAVPYGGTMLFSAAVKDQFGTILSTNVTWSVTTGASVDSTGLFTAPGSGFSGPYAVTASSDGISGAAQAIITSGNLLYKYDNAYDAAGNLKRTDEGYSALAARRVELNYDTIYRLTQEKITTGASVATTDYLYDNGNNRRQMAKTIGGNTVTTTYSYESAVAGQDNRLNQLTKIADTTGKQVTYHYTANGNRLDRTENGVTTTYLYDFENRLVSATQPGNALSFQANYDYRARRVERIENGVANKIVYSGGTSIEEYTGSNTSPDVEYIRGSDYGGGVGGILYSLRTEIPSYFHYNARGDVATKTDASKGVTYQAAYEAFGKRTQESGSTLDRQKANTKEEDITGFLNEGFRYRDLETGVFITRDPAGFVDGPNLYTYVKQNPWTAFDPEGLNAYWLDGTWSHENKFANGITGNGGDTLQMLQQHWNTKVAGQSFYYRGVGNEKDHPLLLNRLARGVTGWGAQSIVNTAYDQVVKDYNGGNREIIIGGWSRGGAEAVQLANKIYKQGIPDTKAPLDENGNPTKYLVKPESSAKTIKQMHLIDPVYSMGVPGTCWDFGWDKQTPSNVKSATLYKGKYDPSFGFQQEEIPGTKVMPYKVSQENGHSDVAGANDHPAGQQVYKEIKKELNEDKKRVNN